MWRGISYYLLGFYGVNKDMTTDKEKKKIKTLSKWGDEKNQSSAGGLELDDL